MKTKTPKTRSSESDAYRNELLGPKKGKVLDLDEVLRAGEKIFDDPNYIQLYGMLPQTYHEMGLRIAGRTAIECTVDRHAVSIANVVRKVMQQHFPEQRLTVVDLFTGSGNLLYHVAEITSASLAIGFESDSSVYNLTRTNFQKLGFQAIFKLGRFQTLFRPNLLPEDQPCIVIIDPPWDAGFSFDTGLDLGFTSPPVKDILNWVKNQLPHQETICVTKTYELLLEESVQEIASCYHICARGITADFPAGKNVGYLVCSTQQSL